MTLRAMAVVLLLPLAVPAAALADIAPRPGTTLSGMIDFPRPQRMTIQTSGRDGARLKLRLGFNGRCDGGGISEAWASTVAARPVVRLGRDGRFSASVRGTSRNLGGVRGRTGVFTWTVSGRFTSRDTATATVSGSADILSRGRVVSRCRIAEPTPARLAARA